jgi:ADP-ribosyl-[dinitrogen reductase] hydrolase
MLSPDPQPYNSWGNGSAMRVSPIAWVVNDLQWALDEAARSAEVTHYHPEGIKGAQAVASAAFLARTGSTKEQIRNFVTETFGYNLDRTLAEIRPIYSFDVSCQGSVPEAITAFLESTGFEPSARPSP